MNKKLTIDDIIELNERLVGYHGIDLCWSSGMAGGDFDLEFAVQLRDILNEILKESPRNTFKYFKKEG